MLPDPASLGVAVDVVPPRVNGRLLQGSQRPGPVHAGWGTSPHGADLLSRPVHLGAFREPWTHLHVVLAGSQASAPVPWVPVRWTKVAPSTQAAVTGAPRAMGSPQWCSSPLVSETCVFRQRGHSIHWPPRSRKGRGQGQADHCPHC